jgi:hypothetical protein
MKVALIAFALLLLGLVVYHRRKANEQVYDVNAGVLPDWATPPPIPGDPRLAKSGGWNAKSLCEKAYGTNGRLITEVPDKHAQYVAKANNVLGEINCGALGYAEKAVGAVIVTPAKKLWNAIF